MQGFLIWKNLYILDNSFIHLERKLKKKSPYLKSSFQNHSDVVTWALAILQPLRGEAGPSHAYLGLISVTELLRLADYNL